MNIFPMKIKTAPTPLTIIYFDALAVTSANPSLAAEQNDFPVIAI